MGVYHLMGLGRSPGAITGPLSYLAHRYQRWNDEDRQFFGRSGEVRQRKQGSKVGDVQACVLFTTPEVLTGKDKDKPFNSYPYVENPPGRIVEQPKQEGKPMKEVLRRLLAKEWSSVAGGRKYGDVFWCQVDRRTIQSTYGRIIQVVAALTNVGGQGHEIWINLTGGNNVINFALELAATLSAGVARLYYVQAENQTAESCIRFTAENGYWVDLPVMPLALGRLSHVILELLEIEPLNIADLYSHLQNEYWDLSRGLDSEQTLRENYLRPLWKQGLITQTEEGYGIGPQWQLIRPYEEMLQQAQQAELTLEKLCQQVEWIEREEIAL